MKLRLAVDVDVVLDVLARREPHYAASATVWEAVETGRAYGLLSAHTFTTVFYLGARYGDRRTAAAAVADLLSVFDVATVDGPVVQHALSLGWPDFEDAVEMAAAVAASASHFVTRNVADYRGAPLAVVTPSEILAALS